MKTTTRVPLAVTALPDELYQAPRSSTERAYPKLIHYNEVDKGGHFAAWSSPSSSCASCARRSSHCGNWYNFQMARA
jgi:hypothetical protein